MNMFKKVLSLCLAGVITLSLTACPANSQQTASQLIVVVGNSITTLLPLIGNVDPTLQSKLKTDFAQASAQVAAWKSGTTTQNIVSTLNIVQQDLSLLPVNTQTTALISLAITTVESILILLPQTSGGTVSVKDVKSLNAPTSAKAYKTKWNSIVAANPSLVKAKL